MEVDFFDSVLSDFVDSDFVDFLDSFLSDFVDFFDSDLVDFVDFFASDFFSDFGASVFSDWGASSEELEAAPPLERVRPAFLEHTGHAPGPWPSRTRLATVICWLFEALFAVEAYSVPP